MVRVEPPETAWPWRTYCHAARSSAQKIDAAMAIEFLVLKNFEQREKTRIDIVWLAPAAASVHPAVSKARNSCAVAVERHGRRALQSRQIERAEARWKLQPGSRNRQPETNAGENGGVKPA